MSKLQYLFLAEGAVGNQINDCRRYQELISSVPMQSTSVSLIMDCMLEQVIHSFEINSIIYKRFLNNNSSCSNVCLIFLTSY